MKIEQIEDNKIQVTFSKEDLDNNQINLHMLMSNSKMTQKLFLSILEIAETEIGFETSNYDIAIETLVLNNSNFIFTISRKKAEPTLHNKPKIKRKNYNNYSSFIFNNFDDFYEFYLKVKFSNDFRKTLYYFNNNFYYLNSNSNTKINSTLLEYAIPTLLPNMLIKNYGKQLL